MVWQNDSMANANPTKPVQLRQREPRLSLKARRGNLDVNVAVYGRAAIAALVFLVAMGTLVALVLLLR
jgi:hypothetical protein